MVGVHGDGAGILYAGGDAEDDEVGDYGVEILHGGVGGARP